MTTQASANKSPCCGSSTTHDRAAADRIKAVILLSGRSRLSRGVFLDDECLAPFASSARRSDTMLAGPRARLAEGESNPNAAPNQLPEETDMNYNYDYFISYAYKDNEKYLVPI